MYGTKAADAWLKNSQVPKYLLFIFNSKYVLLEVYRETEEFL